jgi:hypothetical protein
MNYQEPLKISSVDFSKLEYPKQKQTHNKKIILIKLNEKNRLKNFVFQTPTLLNINKPEKEQENGYAEIEVAFVGKEQKKVDKFIKFLNELENKLKSDAIYNASSWFNLKSSNDTINFQKIIRESSEYKNGTIKLKILKNSDFETILQLDNSKKIKLTEVPENSWCKMILEVYAVWINSNNDFGIFLRPVLISFTAREDVYNYKFIESDEEEDEDDIPDTEVNNNVFVKLDNDIISQLAQDEDTTDINISILNNINLGKSNFSSSSNSLDAETSEDS